MNAIVKLWKAGINRFKFGFIKSSFNHVGYKTLIESPFVINGEKYISLGNHVRIKPRSVIEAIKVHNSSVFFPHISIGDYVSINYDVHIACINNISLGNGVLIASKVFITDHGHGKTDMKTMHIPPSKRKLYSKGPVIIGDNVWIGEGAMILSGVTIGNNSIIGANTVITKDVRPFSVMVGNPARNIKNNEKQNI